METINALIARLERQGGVGHVTDGREFGLRPDSVRKYWTRRGWPTPHRGVILLPGAELTFSRRAHAAATWIGSPVGLTSCGALHLLGVQDRPPRHLQFVVPHSRRNRQWPGGTVHRSDIEMQRPVTTIEHVPCVTAEWALRDLAVFGGPGHLRGLVIAALQRRKTSMAALETIVAANPTAPRMPELSSIVEQLRRDRADSGLELDTRKLLRAHGFDPWPRPFPYRCPDGKVIHLDVAFPRIWFAIECDEEATHSSGRAFYVDRTRWGQAMQGGWRLGFAWRERLRLESTSIIAEIENAHATAEPGRPPAEPAHDCESLGC